MNAASRKRTAELAQANAELEQRVEERTREREAALAQVHEMQKLESLGQLTGGVAHDFNNLLMADPRQSGAAARNVCPTIPPLMRLVDGAMQGAERGATLTKRMLAFARRQELRPETVDVPRLVDGMEEMLRRSLGPAIQIVTTYRPESAADPRRSEPARAGAAEPGAECARRDAVWRTADHRRNPIASEGRCVRPSWRAGSYVCLDVSDTGAGMDEATLKRATEPFFTTKGVGKGTGLGLSMVHGLAAQSGGAMRITSRAGRRHHGRAVAASVRDNSVAQVQRPRQRLFGSAGRPCRVMVVDDDPLVVASTAAMLEDVGHTVTEALSGARALDLLRLGTKVDVVVTDHAMPGMTGAELARQIRQRWPDLPVILATGYAELPNGEDPGLPRLSKPYLQDELAAQIARVMSAAPTNVIPLDSVRRA